MNDNRASIIQSLLKIYLSSIKQTVRENLYYYFCFSSPDFASSVGRFFVSNWYFFFLFVNLFCLFKVAPLRWRNNNKIERKKRVFCVRRATDGWSIFKCRLYGWQMGSKRPETMKKFPSKLKILLMAFRWRFGVREEEKKNDEKLDNGKWSFHKAVLNVNHFT